MVHNLHFVISILMRRTNTLTQMNLFQRSHAQTHNSIIYTPSYAKIPSCIQQFAMLLNAGLQLCSLRTPPNAKQAVGWTVKYFRPNPTWCTLRAASPSVMSAQLFGPWYVWRSFFSFLQNISVFFSRPTIFRSRAFAALFRWEKEEEAPRGGKGFTACCWYGQRPFLRRSTFDPRHSVWTVGWIYCLHLCFSIFGVIQASLLLYNIIYIIIYYIII